MISCGNWFAIIGCFTIAKLHDRIFVCFSDTTLLVLFSHPICSTLLSPCENLHILSNVNTKEHLSYATSSDSGPKIGGQNTQHEEALHQLRQSFPARR